MAKKKARQFPTYPTKIKIVADHRGTCALCGPSSALLYPNLEDEAIDNVKVGMFAHIHSETRLGPRYDKSIPKKDLGRRHNFLYVCKEHHDLIDRNISKFPPDYLKKIRIDHVQKMEETLRKNGTKNLNCAIVILEDTSFNPINRSTILSALKPARIPVSSVDIFLSLPNKDEDIDWIKSVKQIKAKWKAYQEVFTGLKKSNDKDDQTVPIDEYYLFSITKIPFAIYFGVLIQETNTIRLHQWRRRQANDEQTWAWATETGTSGEDEITTSYSNMSGIDNQTTVILKIEVSASIDTASLGNLGLSLNSIYSIGVKSPNRHWLQRELQLMEFQKKYRALMEIINKKHPRASVHLFLAGPIPIAVFIGQIFNPRMDRPLIIYNWQRNSSDINYYKKIFELGNALESS